MPAARPSVFPMRSPAFAVALSLAGVMLAVWNAWHSYRSILQVAETDIRLTRLSGEVMRLDEVLTMSARMAAATGDLAWEKRYLENEPKLDAVIKEAMHLDTHFGVESAGALDEANRRLVEMEHSAFELLRQGNREAAFALLMSDGYETQKKTYAKGNELTLSAVRRRIDNRLHQESQQALVSLGIGVCMTVVLAFSWSRAIRVVRQHLQIQRRAERLAEKARLDALAASRAKSEFLANMSHEIRTPMNGVLGCVELLSNTQLSVEQQQYLITVRNSGQSLLSLLDDILDLSKIEAGKLLIEPIDLDLAALIEETANLSALRIGAKPVEVVAHYSQKAPPRILGDPLRIRQIVSNLTSNALKFTERGHVLITVEQLRQAGEEVELLISVADSGIGIPADKLSHIFDKFTQADASTTRRFGGTGLGLAISRNLAEMMGGAIGVESVVGEGSRFWFKAWFPISTAKTTKDLPSVEGRRVLLVAPRTHAAWALEQAMLSFGSAVTRWEPGEPPAPEGQRWDVVILDESILDREDAGRWLDAARWNGALLRIYATLGRIGQAQVQPDLGLITKPFRRSKVIEALLPAAPLDALPPEQSPAPARAANPGAGQAVLLADDNPVNLLVARKLLEQLGCRVDVASSGGQVLEKLAQNRFALILMDCQMPEMDGFEATARIRSQEDASARTPIVALTAHAMQGDRDRCLAAGMDDYLSKPMTRADLARVLDRWINAAPP